MNRRRITIAAVALVAAVVAVLAVACWGTVRDHVQAWHFQLTRETKTIAPLVDGGALDPFLRREPLLRIAFQELHHPVIFDPPEASQLPRMGNWYQVSLDGEEAARVLRELTRLKPDDAQVRYWLGSELNALGSFLDASESLIKAIQLDPGMARAHRELCVARYNLKQYTQAVESCGEAVRLKPDFSLAYHDLGMSLFDSGHPEEAIKVVEQAIKLQPDFAEAHDTLGYFYYTLGDLRRATESVRQAIKIKPDYAEAYNDLAIILYHMHRYDEVLALLARATSLRPKYSQAYFNLGVTYAALKNREAALKTYTMLRSFDPPMANKLLTEIFKQKILVARGR